VWQISDPSHCRIEQGTQDPRSSLKEFAPELRLVPPGLGRYVQKFNDQRTVEKIRPGST